MLDDASAEYLLKRLRDAEEQYERMKSWYDFQKTKAREVYEQTRTWVESCLRPYFDMVPTKGKKIRSYELPGGVLKLQKQDPEFEVNDEAMCEWLEKTGQTDMVVINKKAKWGDFKKTLPKDKNGEIQMIINEEDNTAQVVTADGEVVPGVTATIRGDKFSVKVK